MISQICAVLVYVPDVSPALDRYGENWDAFWDAITALVDMPLVLRLKNWSSFERRFPNDAALMSDCLKEMVQQYPHLAPRVEHSEP
ncbi:barstar family protein [Paraburkholderia tropica]|uniref:barstar family protein n=1 Tax=Paraburkholderia tropica TaxID=92647 RepID=UPI002AB09581|nr:barstar family protein [Paraburkholderia tropica]